MVKIIFINLNYEGGGVSITGLTIDTSTFQDCLLSRLYRQVQKHGIHVHNLQDYASLSGSFLKVKQVK